MCVNIFGFEVLVQNSKILDGNAEQTLQTQVRLFRESRPRGYRTFFMLNSTKYEIFLAHKC